MVISSRRSILTSRDGYKYKSSNQADVMQIPNSNKTVCAKMRKINFLKKFQVFNAINATLQVMRITHNNANH